nr:hypothetical protein [Tanacetum cinerariifolium]
MSTQQDIYAAGSENCPPMLNKENYVPWSSCLLWYAKSRPNGKLIYKSIINGPYVRQMIPEPADDQAIQTIILGLLEDIYAAVDSCESAQEIWLRVQQMMKGSNIGIQEKKRILSNPCNRQIAQPGMNIGQDKQMQMVEGNDRNQFRQYAGQNVGNLNRNGYLVAARAEGNATGHNGNQIRSCFQLQAEEFDLMAAAADLDEIEEVNVNCILMANLQQALTSGTQTDKAPVYDSDGSAEYTELLEPIPEPHQVPQNDNNVISEISSVEQSGGTVEQHHANVEETQETLQLAQESRHKMKQLNKEIKPANYTKINHLSGENEYAKLWNDWYKKCEECKFDKISYDKAYNDMQQKIERFQAQLGDLKGKSKDTSSVSDTLNPLSQKLENENVELEFQDTTRGTSANNKFEKQLIVGKLPKVGKTYDLTKPVTSNSIPTPQGSKVMKNDKVIATRMFRINPFKTSRKEKHVPNKVRASVMTNLITVSQPPVITKKLVNSDSNGLSSTGIDNTKTRRPQPRSIIKNDRVPSASKSSQSKNKEVEVEEHHRKLLLSRNKKHM